MQCDMKIKDYNENISNLLIEYIQTDKLLSIPALNILWIDILKNLIDGALPDENEKRKEYNKTARICILTKYRLNEPYDAERRRK